MLNFKLLRGTDNVPIFFQQLPKSFKGVSLSWIVFVGSADDSMFGKPGLFHWFEHVPFRGTQKFPNGNEDTLSRFDRWAGHVNAHTMKNRTVYEAYVLKRQWTEALTLLTDLVSAPLLREEDIEAEREIIFEEITEITSNQRGWATHEIQRRVWKNHPFEHEICGTIDSLESMDTSVLRKAHNGAYDRSRCVLVIAGCLSSEEVLAEANRNIDCLPSHSLSERRQEVQYEPPRWWPGTETLSAPFPGSGTVMLFPQPAIHGFSRERVLWGIFHTLVGGGDVSPLMRILREERRLVYGAEILAEQHPAGGYWGFAAQTRQKNVEKVRAAYYDVLRDAQLRSPEWFSYIRDHLLAERDLQVRSPDDYTSAAEDQISNTGRTVSEKEAYKVLASITHDEVIELIDNINLNTARVFIFHGSA